MTGVLRRDTAGVPRGCAFAAVVFASCTPAGGDHQPAFSVSDSAGVEIVRNGEVGALPQPPLDHPMRTLRIGAVDGPPELQFFRVSALAVDEEGLIYVVDAGHFEVRVFDATGAFVRKFGRRGSGPGEFGFPSNIWVSGDTVRVFDTQRVRMSIFDRSGRDLATVSMGDVRAGRIYPIQSVTDGWIAIPWRPPAGFPYEHGVERRDTTRLMWTASLERLLEHEATTAQPDGTGVRPIISIVSGRRVGNQTPIFMSAIIPLFEPEPRYTADRAGRVYSTTAADYVIDVHDVTGRHVRRLTREYPPAPVTAALVGRFADRAKSYWDTATIQGEAAAGKANDEARASTPTVETLPPIGRMLVSAAGTLWVEREDLVPDPIALEWYRGPNEPYAAKWDVFDPDGRFLGTVTLPPTFSPRVVGESWVIGTERDELEVQYVARYEFGR
ncbi:MAG: 6-bladed beta-propeller [Gemmatimonadetes bacterium]|nr:6-bladed beta-propeller [Gemmatimonadota bacterium]